ncbi:MAG: hypothetical protein HYY76_05595 [Acidobacteria bacterium]|nr:hypothetical protein [Acidobacteriota bacterium]
MTSRIAVLGARSAPSRCWPTSQGLASSPSRIRDIKGGARGEALGWFSLLLAPRSAAADSILDPDLPRIRITEPGLRVLFEAGLHHSPTLRALTSRLEASDVVVYVQTDARGVMGYAGRLTFLSVVGGLRYVVVRVTPLRSHVQQLAMIGHELQHAVEVAERPEIVDSSSLYREYMRIGYLNGLSGLGVAVDTKEATEVGGRVTQELRDARLTIPAALLE